MAKIILEDKCVGCGLCVTSCPFNSITLVNSKAQVDNTCTLCGACVDVCPVEAIHLERIERKADLSDYQGVLVFGEQRDGVLAPVVYELIGKGRELADKVSEELECVILGNNLADQAKELAYFNVNTIYLYDDEKLRLFRDDPYTQILSKHVKETKPSIFLIGATAIGRSLGPRIAANIGTGLTADCTELDINPEGQLVQTRPAFGGNVMATIICKNFRPQMATVRYKVMQKAAKTLDRTSKIIAMDVSEALIDRIKIEKSYVVAKETSLTEADIIVSGGKGLGDASGFQLIRELADAFGGVVGSSRIAVDEGWIGFEHQVGLSGKTVRPKLYIACGISGSVQHLAGMQTSDTIVAINKNPLAPIFKVADYGIIGDLYKVIPELIKQLKEYKSQRQRILGQKALLEVITR